MWAKIKGHPYWPAKFERIYGQKNQMVEVYWMNDYRRTKFFRTQLKKFYKHFDEFKENFSKYIGLETAARAAIIYLANRNQKN